jgi:prepilin-type N-terminal cleavage/methylation domain-containing protein
MHIERGYSFVELLVVMAILAIVCAAAVPAFAYLRNEGRAAAGARYVATAIASARSKAVAKHHACGLFFESLGGEWVFWEVEDGNGNDLRTAEIRNGTDRTVSGPHRLGDRIAGARLGFPPLGALPAIPPSSGSLIPSTDPVRFGSSDVVSFGPTGTGSSGTIYVTDGVRGLFGVVLYGPTARLRVWRYGAAERRWTL